MAFATSPASSSVPVSRAVTKPLPPVGLPLISRASSTLGTGSVPPCGAETMIGRSPDCVRTRGESSALATSGTAAARTVRKQSLNTLTNRINPIPIVLKHNSHRFRLLHEIGVDRDAKAGAFGAADEAIFALQR